MRRTPIRVLLLTQWFDPEPTFKGMVFAKELIRQGFEVEVLTGFPNYPGGKVYPGYKIRWMVKEEQDGVRIIRVPLYPNHDQSAIKRILNYASFALSSLIYGLFCAQKPDVVYAYHPPLTVGITATLIRFFRRVPVVYDIQDMWPDTLRATGMIRNQTALNMVGRVCDWVYGSMDRIVVLSPGFKRLLMERGVPEGKLSIIYNWADEQSLISARKALPENFPGEDRFRILFAGNIGKAQSLDVVLDVATRLKDMSSAIMWIFLGGGVEVPRLKKEAELRKLDNVVFLPQVSMSEVGTYLASADALLVHLREDPLFEITIPSKTQAYLAIGKPVLMAVSGDAAALVGEAQAGVTARSEDVESILTAARRLQSMTQEELGGLSENALRFYKERLSLSVGVAQFGEVFRELVERKNKHEEQP